MDKDGLRQQILVTNKTPNTLQMTEDKNIIEIVENKDHSTYQDQNVNQDNNLRWDTLNPINSK